MVGVTRHHLQYTTARTATRIRVSNLSFMLRAKPQERVTLTIPEEGVTDTPTNPLTREDATLAMTMNAMYVKSNGIKMVSPLLKLGLSNHTFVFMCVLLPLELWKRCSFPWEVQTLTFKSIQKTCPLKNGMKTLTLPLLICTRLSVCPLDSQCPHTFIIEPHNGLAKMRSTC